jgi:hypothetical protein
VAHPGEIIRDFALDEATERLHELRKGSVAPPPALDVGAALIELAQKDRGMIETEAALTWGARAIASFTMVSRTTDPTAQTLRFSEGEEFATESREHAASIGDAGKILSYLNSEIDQAKRVALAALTAGRY